jgi:hypothetical protein
MGGAAVGVCLCCLLDVYYASLIQGEPHPKEHAEARWIETQEIAGLDWAEADRPVLPILKRVLDRGLEDRPLLGAIPIVSVDWSRRRLGRSHRSPRSSKRIEVNTT